jgi:hypothetical protein
MMGDIGRIGPAKVGVGFAMIGRKSRVAAALSHIRMHPLAGDASLRERMEHVEKEIFRSFSGRIQSH